MRYIRINEGHLGLVIKNGAVKEVLSAGRYFRWNAGLVEIHENKGKVNSTLTIDRLLKNEALEDLTDLVTVSQDEVAMIYEHGIFKRALGAGRYLYWKGDGEYAFAKANTANIHIDDGISATVLDTFAMASYVRKYVVEAGSKAVLMVNGKFDRVLDAGTYRYWKNATSILVATVDVRSRNMEISGQELLTRDKATIRVNLDVGYRVTDVVKAMLESKTYEKQLYTMAQLALRSHVGKLTLDELLETKASLGSTLEAEFSSAAAALGVEITGVGLRDVILTGDMREMMNRVLLAEKEAQAGTIKRRDEAAATRTMLNAAKLMEDNAMLYKLKEMEYVEKIAEKVGEITVSGNGGVVKQLKEIFETAR